ncbi:MAG: YIP1 family protein [Clostridia bacterium]|nr:YIP1 family protein [Clostridia bacterium]
MKNSLKKAFVLFVSLVLVLSISHISVSAESYSSYQERVDQSRSYMVKQRPVFSANKVVDGQSLNVSDFSFLADSCIQNDKIYLLDSGNSRIVVLNNDYSLSGIIDNFNYNGESVSLAETKGLFVGTDGRVYIADPINQRVLIFKEDGSTEKVITKPESPIIPSALEFKAKKVLVDCDGYMFVLCDGVYYGAMVFDKNYKFCGFFGANQTQSNLLDTLKYFISKIFQTDIKKQYSIRALPFEFDDLCEHNGFIYTATQNAKNNNGQIRKLSNSGVNTLNHSGVSGDDYKFGNGKIVNLIDKTTAVERFCSVAVDDNEYIYALDATYGRVFVYDTECNLITAFGGGMGLGKQIGSFTRAAEVAVIGTDVLVIDSELNKATVFSLTDYGKLFYQAINVEAAGEYDKSFPMWQKILSSDAFNQRAYTGMANYYFANREYEKSREFAKKALNKELYDQAFEEVRREFLSRHFVWLFVIAFLALGLVIFIIVYRKKNKKQKDDKEKGYVYNALTSVRHPIKFAQYIKRIRTEKKKKELNIYTLISLFLIFLMYIFKVLETTAGGFLYTDYDPYKYSSALVFISTFGVAVLWCIVNWGLCTLFQGKGTFREIVVVTGVAVIPQIIYSIFFIISSHFLVYSETAIISGAGIIAWLVTIVILLIQLSVIHDYSFFRAIGMSLATVLGMCIAAFMILLVLTLFQDLIEFVRSLYNEIIYR